MKTLKNIITLFLLTNVLAGCVDNNEYYPLDIITGKEKVDDIYFQKNMKNPVVLKGKISSYESKLPVADVDVIAKASGMDLQYQSKTKADGSFYFYVEGQNEYVVYTQKTGWEKQYIFNYSDGEIDTVRNYYSGNEFLFQLFKEDSIREVQPEYIATRYLSGNIDDLTTHSGSIWGLESNKISQYNDDAAILKTQSLKVYPKFISVQDTFYWYGSSSGRTVYKVGMIGGKQYASVYCQIANETIYDLEVINNAIWILTNSRLYHLNLTGDLIKSYNFGSKIPFMQFVGMAKGVNSIYILNKIFSQSFVFPGYKIYKFDTSSGQLTLQTCNFPKDLTKLTLRSLAYKNGIFWSISDGYYSDDLVRIRVTE